MAAATARATTRPGRPRDWDKRSTIIETARRLFLEAGLDAVTIEGVAAAAGVSKVTVYSHFRDKSTLFESVIEEERQSLDRHRIAVTAQPNNLRDTLKQFGFQVVQFVTRPETVSMTRLLVAQLHRYPQLAQSFFDSGAAQRQRDLARLLSNAADLGELKLANARRAADHLLSMFTGLALVEQRYGLRPPPKSAEIEAHVSECVDVFLRAYSTVDGRGREDHLVED